VSPEAIPIPKVAVGTGLAAVIPAAEVLTFVTLACPDKSTPVLSTILSDPIVESTIPANFKSPASNLALESSPEAKSSISIPFPKS